MRRCKLGYLTSSGWDWVARVPAFVLGASLWVLPRAGLSQNLAHSPAPARSKISAPTAGEPTAPVYKLPRIAFALRLGLVAVGTGKDSVECEGADCGLGESRDVGYRHRPSLHLGGEVLWQPMAWLRTGPSIGWSLPGKIEIDAGARPIEYGALLSADWVLEFTPQLDRRSWLLPRIQAGYSMLSPSGNLKTNLDGAQSACETSTARFEGCSSIGGLHSGVNVGVGVGVLFAASPTVRLRLDTLAELYWLKLMAVEATAASAKVSESNYAARFLVIGGLEF